MVMNRKSFLMFCVVCGFYSTALQAAVYGPGWWDIKGSDIQAGQLVKIESAGRKMLMGEPDTVTPEIAELAYGLEYDPLRILEFVRNHIQYVPYWGSLKGATQTLLDRTGNDLDQAALLIALLKAGGYDCSYVQGTMNVSLSDAAEWLGCGESQVTNVLSAGGIGRVVINGDVAVNRFWVRLTVGSTTNQADPAYKPCARIVPVDLAAHLGYTRTNLLSAVVPGGQSGTDYVQQLSEANLRAKMAEYATNLVSYLRASYPNTEVSQILGGRPIQETSFSSWPSLTYTHVMDATFTTIPTQYVHYLRIQLGTIDQTMKASEVAGQRLSITFNNDSPPKATVWLEDEQKWTETSASGSQVSLNLYGITPYNVATSNSYLLTRGSTNSYAIISAFNGVETGNLLKKRQKILAKYQADGYTNGSREVRTETLNVIGQSWMQQTALAEGLLYRLSDLISIVQHRYGIVAQESGYYIDVANQVESSVSATNGGSAISSFHAGGLSQSAMEHGVLEQLQSTNNQGISTVRILQLANANSDTNNNKIFYATQSNYASVVQPALGTNYTTQEKQGFLDDVNAGRILILPQKGSHQLNQWRGTGYVVASSNLVQMIISGHLNGGYSSLPAQLQSTAVVQNSIPFYLLTPAVYYAKSDEPVVLATCAYDFQNTDLTLGNGNLSGLALTRSYNSARSATKTAFGYGWTHNFDISVSERSDPDSSLGLRSPVDAAAFVVAALVSRDLVANQNDAKGWVTAALASKWAMDQLTKNSVTVQMGPQSLTYIRLPDGTYIAPPGVTATLTKNGSQYRLTERFGITYEFNADGTLAYRADADDNRTYFAYSGGLLQTVSNNFGYRLTFNYAGGEIDTVSDSSGRTVDYTLSSGNLTQFADPASKTWQYVYDSGHHIVSLRDPLSQTTISNRYGSSGCVTAQVSATGFEWKFRNSFYRNIEENPQGGRNIYWFDEKTRQISQQDASSNRVYSFYDGQNHVTNAVDARGFRTVYQYDAFHNRTNIVDALSNQTAFAYDSQYRLASITDPLSHVTRLQYDSEHHLTNSIDATTNSVRTTYYANGLVQTVTDPRGSQTSYTYDGFGNPLTIQRTNGGTVTNSYNSRGDVTTATDPNGNPTTYVFDSRRLLLKQTDVLGNSISNAYNDAGQLVSTRDPRSFLTTRTYTPSYKLKSIAYPDTGVVSNFYDSRDWMVAIRDARGGIMSNQYDNAERVTNAIDALGHSLSTTYDPAGNVLARRDALGNVVSNTYDALGRVVKTVDPLGNTVQNSYDTASRLTSVVDESGIRTDYEYDAAGRRTARRRLDVTEQSQHDGSGNLVRFVNGEGQPLSFGYDGQNRQVAETNAIGNVKRLVYDSAGNITRRIDAQSRTNLYQFDGANRLVRSIHPDGQTNTFSYDPAGNLTNMTDAIGVTRCLYDSMGRMVSVTDTRGQTVSNRFDLAGNRIAIVYPGALQVAYNYDPANRLTNVVDWTTNRTAYSFDDANRLTGIGYPNGVSGAFSNDKVGRVVGYAYSRAGSNLIARVITRDRMGLKWRENVSAGLLPMPTLQTVETRAHDNADRLTNVISRTAPDAGSSSTNPYTYDANGNLISAPSGVQCSWDFDNRLTQYQASGVLCQYAYDGLGDRIRRVMNDATNYHVLDRAAALHNVLMETGTNGLPMRYYVWGANGLLAQVETNGTAYYFHSDELGSTLALTDTNGNRVAQYAYGPNGESWGYTGTVQTVYTFIGGQGVYHETADLYHMKARYYSAEYKRFLSSDPIGIQGGLNLYIYGRDNPLAFVDPLGLLTVHIWNYTGSGPNDAWGHASITLDNGTHISWWPQSTGRESSSLIPNVYEAEANPNQTLGRDKELEGNDPDKEIRVTGLDEAAIQKWWDTFKTENKWKTLSQNCSTTAADALKAGGADVLWRDVLKAHNMVWTPADVGDYANAINRKTADQKNKPNK